MKITKLRSSACDFKQIFWQQSYKTNPTYGAQSICICLFPLYVTCFMQWTQCFLIPFHFVLQHHVILPSFSLLSPLNTPLKCLELANCCLNRVDMTYLANSLHSEALVCLDISGHNIFGSFSTSFHKLLSRCKASLASLALEECDISDEHMDDFISALSCCQALEQLKILGNPLTSAALRQLFSTLSAGFPKLRYIEFPVPRECYSEDVTYPLDDIVLLRYNRELFQEVKDQLMGILAGAGKGSVEVCTPLMGAYDADINETSNELGVSMLKSFNNVIGNFIGTITDVDNRRSQSQNN